MNYQDSLVEILKLVSPKSGVEVGVHKGSLSEFILREFPDLTLYMVDPYTFHTEYPNQDNNLALATNRVRKFGDRAFKIYEDSKGASEFFEKKDQQCDFVFIDADHEYESVLDDLAYWYQHVRTGGILCGHDYGKDDIPGVTKAVNEWRNFSGNQVTIAEGNIWWLFKP